jgi:hypothetical protein
MGPVTHEYSDMLSTSNVDTIIAEYTAAAERVGQSIANLNGLELLAALKRSKVAAGPYPDVALFEAANRIMSDLVILHGVRWLLHHDVFPFDSSIVEYGNEDKKGFDIRASANGKTLIGEAFNVAPSFFQIKKGAMLRKLRNPAAIADFKVILINHDAVPTSYVPRLQDKEFIVVVDIRAGVARVITSRSTVTVVVR